MIVFGWYSWCIRAYRGHELGLTDIELQYMRFEVRQKCFHIFWIPFFSIGKMYIMRKEEKMYEVTPEFQNYMRTREAHKTPWYAFLGLILIPVCYLLYLGNEKLEQNRYDEVVKEAIADRLNMIDNPQIHDFYKLKNAEDYSKSCLMRVEKITKDSILIGMPAVISEENKYFRGANKMNEYFDGLGSQLWTAWIAKCDLKQAVNTGHNFKAKIFPELLVTGSFEITDIERESNR